MILTLSGIRVPSVAVAAVAGVLLLAAPASGMERHRAPHALPVAPVRDVPADGRLFQRGIPVTQDSFSPHGFHFAYLHSIPGGIIRRRPQRCAFLLDLVSGENRAAKTPKGVAVRVGGWDPTGRFLLLETQDRGWLSALTSSVSTYHWIFDVVTSEFVPRRSFAGMRDGVRFRWKASKTYHGTWGGEDGSKVWPMYEGELAEQFRRHDEEMNREEERRQALAERLAVGSDGSPEEVLGEILFRLDEHWTQRGHRDPIVSELFGDRPELFWKDGDEWIEIRKETEYVAVLDRGLALVTGQGGAQVVFCPEKWETVLLPPVPGAFIERLETRWDRSGGFYDENDPLPRDLQYRRSVEAGSGRAHYFNYVTPNRKRLLILYVLGAEKRILRVVDLPEHWELPVPVAKDAAPVGS
ncbi:hypothetical protein K8I85_11455 [bacterium]|nr:hypothetical protein [bacterium]